MIFVTSLKNKIYILQLLFPALNTGWVFQHFIMYHLMLVNRYIQNSIICNILRLFFILRKLGKMYKLMFASKCVVQIEYKNDGKRKLYLWLCRVVVYIEKLTYKNLST